MPIKKIEQKICDMISGKPFLLEAFDKAILFDDAVGRAMLKLGGPLGGFARSVDNWRMELSRNSPLVEHRLKRISHHRMSKLNCVDPYTGESTLEV